MGEKELKKEAKEWGRDTVRDIFDCGDLEEYLDEYDNDKDEAISMLSAESEDSYTQGAGYANNILPELRSMAGCKDTFGVGTYTDCTEEQEWLYDELATKFLEGYASQIRKDLEDC